MNKRLYKEVTEAQLTAVLIITVRNSLGREVDTLAPVETVGNILSGVSGRECNFHPADAVKRVADPEILNTSELALILKLK